MENKSNKPKIATRKHVARLERERKQVALVWTVAIVMFGVIALLLGYGYLDINYLQLQKPVATVNGEEISIEQWQERVQLQRVNLVNIYQQYQFFQQQFGMDVSQQIQEVEFYLQSPEATGQLVLDQMVNEILVRQEADKRGITLSEDEIEASVKEAYRFFPDGTPVPTATATAFEFPTLTSQQLTLYPATPTPTPFLTFTPEPTFTPDPDITPTATAVIGRPTPTFVPEDITPTATPFTLEGFQSEYQATLDEYESYGISEATLRSAYSNDLFHKKVLEAITTDMPTTEEQVWARHILVASETEAKAVIDLLKNGSDFSKLAQQYSTDTGSGSQGGDLGWFGKGAMVPEFESIAYSLPIGEISEPVQSQFGYHIIQVLGRQELPLSESQLQQNRETAFSEWLTTATEEAEITKDDLWMQHIPPMPAFGATPAPN